MPSPNNNNYADLECLLKKIDTCHNNPDLSSTTKINHHIP